MMKPVTQPRGSSFDCRWFALRCVAVVGLAFSAGAWSAGGDFKPPSSEIRRNIRASCQAGLDSRLGEDARSDTRPALARWISRAGLDGAYCDCATDTFVADAGSALFRPDPERKLDAVMRTASMKCLLPAFIESFPAFCSGVFADLAATSGMAAPVAGRVETLCACVQEDVAALTVSGFGAYLSSSLRDHATFLQFRKLPPAGRDSLVASLRRCGFDDLRRSADNE
ncbi:hypothetical protein [Methyloversatilis universalis]|uniref:hypothetical protein n=1 Tax=Methyloversatilis universalis TaxID=378211 RepID=UPI00036D3760|nr:hypothetical protein [Methyloversatilis universalis]